MTIYKKQNDSNGSVLVSILIVTLFITTILFSLMELAGSNLVLAKKRIVALQAQYAAESGADLAISTLNSGNTSYTGTVSDVTLLTSSLYKATFSVTVTSGSTAKERYVRSVGKVYTPSTATSPSYTRTVEVMAQRSSTTTASSVLSRNIIDIQSSVKNVKAKDIYVNGYIKMNKNTTNLIAENITVADRNTGAGNCSISGTGNLVKPTSFITPGQTKTNIMMAYNNCIIPPGNVSTADFNILANQGSISKIQSTNIPWSQYMDGSYQNGVSGCSDWTSGAFPRSIPSTGNTKKTHYPDNLSNVSTTCGTSGDISLGSGQYNIKDHVHLRANLCAATACEPIFYNPDTGAAGIKFIFIEGTVNFNSLHTAAGSGPIVFVVYGADPAAKVSICPLGGSVYVGNSSTTTAPAIYFLATNGICLDKIKFGSGAALGGISGKNIWIDTNSGQTFDLEMDLNFPVSSIPIDLSWRATRYRRL